MRKRIVYLSPLLLIILFGFFFSPFSISDRLGPVKPGGLQSGIVWAQGITGDERGDQESHYTQLMKQLRATVNGWLKDLNQRIESEDVTRFEVRFLEILRSLLEWVGEKIDAQIESGDKKPKRKMKGEEV